MGNYYRKKIKTQKIEKKEYICEDVWKKSSHSQAKPRYKS